MNLTPLAGTLLQTAQRMQDDTFNANFNGAPLDSAAVAFIQNDNFGEWIGGKYYDLSQVTAAQKADPNINGYALYTRLNSNDNGGIGALMPATGYSLEQYSVLARNDYNSGQPQSQAFDVQFQQWKNQNALSFLYFNGKLALMGGTAGLNGGLPLLGDAFEGTKIGSFLQYALASRGGAAATGAVVNTTAQLIENGGHVTKINPVAVVVSAATGGLGGGRQCLVEHRRRHGRRRGADGSDEPAVSPRQQRVIRSDCIWTCQWVGLLGWG